MTSISTAVSDLTSCAQPVRNHRPIANEAVFATVQEDAKRTATQIAERIGDYYRREGWTS